MMGALEEAGERLEEARLALPPGAAYPGEPHPAAASIADSVGMLSTTERQLRWGSMESARHVMGCHSTQEMRGGNAF